ncbi:YciI family protein [Photobacterium sp. TY1-4]|uniref:YciI family protein n=1 Tax=Photobacterium sp. TY1-4 TaxID=2899122 RepID=UPI0021C163FB|nr:YciI family protein [Photobacterium sp. TY1-4]UXI03463.1 YciI family protein [Photobacterium sp. TY1-4]
MAKTNEQVIQLIAALATGYLTKEYQSNNLRFGGRRVPRTGGILISQHECEQALRAVLDADPFIQSGAVSYSITEFTPVMAAEAYAHLLT